MRHWKKVLTGFLMICLFLIMSSVLWVNAEEYEEEDPVPESYYYTIETNQLEGWPQGPAIESASAAVMDLDSGAFLYSKNALAKMYPASTTKIMTTLLLIENCDLDETITFSEIVFDLEEGSSHIGIQPGEKMTLRDCAYGIMLESANDVSNGVAEYIAGSRSAFADMMNEKAASLGCVNTHFSNPHGLYSEDHYTCAYDMALIAAAAYNNPTFREIVGTRYYNIPETNLTEEIRYLSNHHKILQKDSDYHQEWCTGGKTGYTEACLNTLVTFGEQDGRRQVAVVFRVNGAGKAYNETSLIMEYGFDHFTTRNVAVTDSDTCFYDVIGLKYPGDAGNYQSEIWKRKIHSDILVSYTLPNDISDLQLEKEVIQMDKNREKTIVYRYRGWDLGTAHCEFYPFAAPVEFSFQRPSRYWEENQPEEASVENQIVNQVVNEELHGFMIWVSETAGELITKVLNYSEQNLMVLVVVGVVIFLIILLLVIVLIFRATSDMRRRRKRKQEERERLRREEEIDRMTTAEIEAELRAVMKEENDRKEAERRRQEQAEEEARKIRETENLLEELEMERQEQIKGK